MKRISLFLLCVMGLSLIGFGAGTVTQTVASVKDTGLKTLTFMWTADAADGSVPNTLTSAAVTDQLLGKYIVLAVTKPGTVQPTANYDITILDAYSNDMFGTGLANRSATAAESVGPATVSRPVDAAFTLTVSNNSVNSAIGYVKLYFSDVPASGRTAFADALAGCLDGQVLFASAANIACDADLSFAADTLTMTKGLITTSLLPVTAGSPDFGSATKPWKDFYFSGGSGTPGTNNYKITGTSTGGLRTITFQDASGTVYVSGGTDVPVTHGGTGQSTASAGFNALSPMSALG